MTVPPGHRSFSDANLAESTTSIATSPVAVDTIAPCAGFLHKVYASSRGTFTGTITVAVTVTPAGSAASATDVAGGTLTIAAGSGVQSSSVEIPKVTMGSGLSAVYVNEGDVITFTPSGGTGASIPGSFLAVIREF